MRFILLVVLVVSGCSINTRSDQFACENTPQCDPGQTCQNGFCISGGQPTDGPNVDPDGPIPNDSFVCPPQCTSCNSQSNTCTIDCNISATACTNAINCPAGFNCNILCTRNDLCQNINCSQAESCKIECKGNATCRNVTCGPGACDVTCTGQGSCRAVDCDASCACDVNCNNNATCLTISCPNVENQPLLCDGLRPNVCTSEPDACDTCQ